MRPFCKRCANTFSFITGTPSSCNTRPPSTVCLHTNIPSGVSVCDRCKNNKKYTSYYVEVRIASRPPAYPSGISYNFILQFASDSCSARYLIGEYDPLPPPGSSNIQISFTVLLGDYLRIAQTPFPPDFTFRFVENLKEGDGCLQTLHLIGNENSNDTATMYPVIP